MTIGEKIRSLRKRDKMTQTDLGKLLGVKKNAVCKWERGEVTDIPAGRIKAMAKIFDVPPSYLIDESVAKIPCQTIEGGVPVAQLKIAIFGDDEEITDEMYEEVKRFAAFIKMKHAGKP